jgi:hypothetical protein
MQLFDTLNNKNYPMYAVANYDNPQCVCIEEFDADLNRVKYIKRLITRYRRDGDLQERLILNHLVIFYNVFGIVPATRLLVYKLRMEDMPALKSFLLYLDYITEDELDEIPIDTKISRKLLEIQ